MLSMSAPSKCVVPDLLLGLYLSLYGTLLLDLHTRAKWLIFPQLLHCLSVWGHFVAVYLEPFEHYKEI